MGIKIPNCKNIKHKYTYNKKYTYINKPVFIFIVILSGLIIYAKLRSISGWRPSLLNWIKATDIHSFWGWTLYVLIPIELKYFIGSFSWGHRLGPYWSCFEETYVTDDNLLNASLLPNIRWYTECYQ